MPRHPFAVRLVLPVAAVELLVQLAFANGYGDGSGRSHALLPSRTYVLTTTETMFSDDK